MSSIKRRKWNGVCLPLISLLLFSAEVSAKDYSSCDLALLDDRYGNVSQLDPDLKGLLNDDGTSMLCGPTCLVNVMSKVRAVTGIPNSFQSPVEELEYITKNVLPAAGLSVEELKNYGSSVKVLNQSLKNIFSREGLTAKLQPFSSLERAFRWKKEITLDELSQSLLDHSAVIVNMGRYTTQNLDEVGPATREAGHYMIFAGFVQSDPSRVLFNDPLRPGVARKAKLSLVRPKNFLGRVYQVNFEDSPPDNRAIFITGGIEISNIQKMTAH
jgi:hypothetical protein